VPSDTPYTFTYNEVQELRWYARVPVPRQPARPPVLYLYQNRVETDATDKLGRAL